MAKKYKKEELSEKDVEKANQDIEKESKEDPCWDDYEKKGTKEKDGKEVPNCVPKKEADDDEESDDKTDDKKDGEKDDKEVKESFEDKCKSLVKDFLVDKENLSEMKDVLPEGLSEEFFEKFDTIVTGLINESIQNSSQEIVKLTKETLDAEVLSIQEAHKACVDEFVSVELDKFKESQKEAIVSSAKLEKAEKFLNSIKDLFVETNIILNDEDLNLVTKSEEKVSQLEGELNSKYEAITSLKKVIAEKEIVIEMVNLTKDMPLNKKERLEAMLENVDKSNSANYIKEASKLKNFIVDEVNKSKKNEDEVDVTSLNESKDETKADISLDEVINNILNKKV